MSLLHIARAKDWDAAVVSGQYGVSTRGALLDEVGFIHASSSLQVAAVAAFAYADEPDALVVLVIDEDALREHDIVVRYQDGGNGTLFPHVFGHLGPSFVSEVRPAGFVDGRFAWLRPGNIGTFEGTIVETDVAGAVAGERRLLDPVLRRDRAAADRLLAPGFSEIGRSGQLWQRGELLDEIGRFPSSEGLMVSELEASVLSLGVVLLRYCATHGDGTTRWCSLWRATPDGWRIEFRQGTPVGHRSPLDARAPRK
jgi:uncharacterized protein (DUF952 family)